MYLKALEITGFKSFAEKTKLMFEPGMTAIVGPNGCGKSNVSDAVRWVLGEQSAKALRGTKMEDCIFNGTKNRKPLGMAEVSITFTDCEDTLNTDFHEVTITRRVFRSGEGQYFVNKKACRLRDIQRMFMDTGVGTSSYSFMAQGRIDQILSARPEDRRSIFEEASGITKYKNDKKEAIRKLDHTEANLLRLTDVIREVKRQIGSLQRQAGKARRYKAFRDELRKLDLFASAIRLREFDSIISKLDGENRQLSEQIGVAHHEVESQEAANVALREEILETERKIASAMEASVQAQSRLDRTQDMIRINSQRIDEYEGLLVRDSRELNTLQSQIEENQALQQRLTEQLAEASEAREAAKTALDECNAKFNEHRQKIDELRREIQKLRGEAVNLENQSSKIHNELVKIEGQERSTLIRRERLAAEKQQLQGIADGFQQQLQGIEKVLKDLMDKAQVADANVSKIEERRGEVRQQIREKQQVRSELLSERARRQTTVELLSDAEEAQGDFAGGARLLLDGDNRLGIERDKLRGALAEYLVVPEKYTRALEAALRPMLDALVVEDEAALRDFLVKVAAAGEGAVRLIARQSSVAAAAVLPAGMVALAEHISPVSDEYREMVQRLLGSVAVVEGVDDVPADIAADCVVVTLDGILIHGDGRGEFWMGESGSTNPISRRNAVNAAQQAIEKIEADIATVEAELQKLSEQAESLEQQAGEARRSRDEARRQFAQQEGESRTVERESKTAAKRLETVSWELEELQNKGSGWETQKQELQQKQAETRESRERVSRRIAELNKEQQELEAVYNALQTELMEKKIAFSNADSRVGHIKTQLESSTNRINEINASLQGRSEGLKSYSENIDQLKAEIKSAQDQLEGLENAVKDSESRTKSLREERVKKSEVLSQHEHALAANRENLEKISRRKSELDVQLTESGMRRQTLLERVTGDYTLTLEQIFEEPEPEWDGDAPSVEEAETRVAELRAKLESMGPVNLVAIEEYQEHEERYTFLTQQEADLVKAKEQLLEMIKKINQTTSEMFRQTFEKANTNFQSMFTRLFNGGSAKLVLVNEEDVLDCGIEIVARPPGKRLQNISLLSGGERTLTAVALLFSIYQIKPSPFCMLDELDAPLDDTNIGRFIEVLKEFLKQSQFVVITHNRQTTAASSVIYGVTMPEQGVSRIMSMKFKDNKPDADAESEAADGDEPSEE